MNYHNENDPFAAQWLRNLIAAGLIPPGEVDERSIADVRAGDLEGFTQCHFFAGIGGWPLALGMAMWPHDRSVWTGSCPCQPFSGAGKRKGTADKRHLWPELQRLIAQRRPPVIFGEQVASPDGRRWLAGVRADLEAMGHAVGAADLCAAGKGAPHIRQRLWWVAYADGGLAGDRRVQPGRQHGQQPQNGGLGGLGDAHEPGPQGRYLGGFGADERTAGSPGMAGFWDRYEVVRCTDGKARRFEPGSFPLAHGATRRVGRIRAYGNAVVPQVAAAFIKAADQAMSRTQNMQDSPGARSAEAVT